MTIPTLSDWEREEPYSWPPGHDVAFAFHLFYRRSIEDAAKQVFKNPYGCAEALGYMPEECCRYYISAFACYLMSPESKGDSDTASLFVNAIEEHLEVFVAATQETILNICDAMNTIENQLSWYDIDVSWFDVNSISRKIETCRARLNPGG